MTGAALGAALFTAELLAVTTADGGWNTLGTAPLLVWAAGALAGCCAGVVSWRVGPTSKVSPSAAAERVSLGVVLTLVAGCTIVQVNDRWLPHTLDPRSLAATAAIAGGFVALGRFAGGPVGRIAARAGARPLATSAAAALIALGATVLAPSPSIRLASWQPESTSHDLSSGGSGTRRLLVVGIDGARWETIDPLIATGRMPNLGALVARGTRGVLRSSIDSWSPVVWTTIFTGWPPAAHGITDWEVAISTNRRRRPIWSILDSLGWTTFVENVPGSYPAEPVSGGMLAGFPMPQGSRSNRGWLATPGAATDPRGPIPVPLPALVVGGKPARVVFSDLPASFALERSTPYLLLRRASEALALEIARRVAAVPYLALDVELVAADGGVRLRARSAGDGRPLFELGAGEWGPWLSAQAGNERCIARPRAVALPGGGVGLFVTALFPEAAAGFSFPPGLAASLQRAGQPYVAEPTGWQIFYEPLALGPLEEHLQQVAESQTRAAIARADRAPWDAFIHVFTLTDRVQHPYWKFREPDLYLQYAQDASSADRADYVRWRPTPEQVANYGGAIDRAYELVDRWVGELVARTGDSTLVLVVSDHGAQGGRHRHAPTAGIHHEDGIYLLAGPTVRPASSGPELEQVDVVPLVLAHLGLPVAADLPGRVPPDLAPRGANGRRLEVGSLPSYEAGARGAGQAGEISESVRDQLRSLGYVK
jgi:predicted AlkP superfamily phosphohydrolase/phosphomutase